MSTGESKLRKLGHKLVYVGEFEYSGGAEFKHYKCEGCGYEWSVSVNGSFWLRESRSPPGVMGWGVLTCSELIVKWVMT